MWVYIVWKWYATQWPAPDGFHVPLNTEWQAIVNIWTALGGWSTNSVNFSIALKLPFAGARDNSYADVYGQGDYGYYWSSSRYDAGYAYILFLYRPDGTLRLDTDARARGYSVRCFKNSPAIPTSSWTKLYWTSIESWWIFWSSNEWLISLSSDWQTWITIQDKNLGATQLWNSWDTLSEANAWKYYQWGNNYWFPRTWSVTTSLTQVDASSYWPWNYYSSNTFILKRSSPYRWDTTDNANLRWWVDGNVPTMSELKHAYIGEYLPPIDTPWIYHNATLWLISLSSDWESWLTISDKNLWATTVYNDGDTLSEANCGKYFQWGNNYGFPFTWPTATSSTKVNAQNYWPWNYYNSGTFITVTSSPYTWDSSQNQNLRWWTTWTNIAMQWPCQDWFHIAKYSEWETIINTWITLWAWSSWDWDNFKKNLKIPKAWRLLNTTWSISNVDGTWFYWTPIVSDTSSWKVVTLRFSNTALWQYNYYWAEWHSIRPFKNDAVQPDTSWTKLY